MRDLIILGASGSIGKQAFLSIDGQDIKVRSVSIGKNLDEARCIINTYNIEYVSVLEEKDALTLKKEFPNVTFGYGDEGLIRAITDYKGDVLNAISGIAGLMPTVKALECKKNVLLANKETIVCAGKLIFDLAKANNVSIIPIDSEHNAIYRLLKGNKETEIKKLIITASGGAFRDVERTNLKDVTLEDALNHPNWSMGKKITVDCATMVNKGLEVIEAHYLFNIDYDRIETVIHKESIIHSMVEYSDNSMGAVMYNPSMIIPIQYAIFNELIPSQVCSIDFTKTKELTFRTMDFKRFPMLKLAYHVGKVGGLLPTVYNASNELAVKLFIEGKIKFLDIETIIETKVKEFEETNKNKFDYTVEDILRVDKEIKNSL